MNDEQLQRYARHVLLEGIGIEGQQRWLASHALVIGAGGLGSSALLSLAAAGVGRITVMDADTVDLSNLQRQVIHTTARVGQAKVESARCALQALNPGTDVVAVAQRADPLNLPARVAAADVVLDCSDNYATRQAVNAACVTAGKPLVWAAGVSWHAQASVWWPGRDGPCYACLFPPQAPVQDTPCSTLGVFAPLVGLVGMLQAGEALKGLAGLPTLAGRLWMWDAQQAQTDTVRVQRRHDCEVCSNEH
ncbi:MAG: HesA/MoeB/ThiF family protein [Inhella sp.]|jgi:molybdopterin/thiamine biosynthesis adenylyltransferase|uniref:HesA/MoeB/ThiF family protein n=1 Tax=Inhella sp. TaxID=1921806 RepID=UPI0022C920B9|nr:HesA/MoeB/ThiF family protein [Inhella sp.]MCZ8234908.1 HesA/MoeB/ThiF family protein [Inhella sp.]